LICFLTSGRLRDLLQLCLRKWHALIGNLLALFVFDLLDESVRQIASAVEAGVDLQDLLAQLEVDDRSALAQFWSAAPHSSLKAIVPDRSERETIDWDLLVKGPAYCHLSLLPSETRRKGIVTNDTSRLLNLFSRETGAVARELIKTVDDSAMSLDVDTMRLVYEASDKAAKNFQCDHQLSIDFREYFYVAANDGWKHVIVPNDAEQLEYGHDRRPIQRGVIAFCLKWCNWNACPLGHVDIAGFVAGNATVQVNGLAVTNFTKVHSLSQECVVTSHANGRFWLPNDKGRFVIRARAESPGTFMRFTSFIVWPDTVER
jgi:hypothetical protein